MKRFNAFTVPGLTENEAISKKIQLHVSNAKYRTVKKMGKANKD